MRYLLVVIDFKMTLIINLRSEKVCDILHYDFTTILGMFFINSPGFINVNDDLKFCLVFNNKIVFFKISSQPNLTSSIVSNLSTGNVSNETISEIKTIKMNTIINFYYNPRFLILCIEKSERNFDFFNLSSEKHYTKPHSFTILLKNTSIKRDSSISSFFGLFSRKSKQEFAINDIMDKEALYKKNQFFIETLYKKLYFICLNYEEAEIQVYEIENLQNIKKFKTIIFENTQISTLQFVDNLILLHNFERCDTLVIDIKSESQDKVMCKQNIYFYFS